MMFHVLEATSPWVTGQLADCQLADWTTRGLADGAKRTKTKHSKSPVASGSCLVREMSSPRVVQSASWRIRELSSNLSMHACAVTALQRL